MKAAWSILVGGAAASLALIGLWSGCATGGGFRTETPSYRPPGYDASAEPLFKHAKVIRENYHGWTNAVAIRNHLVEVIIVPDIGRVMSFNFLNEENVFWEDPALWGKPANPEATEWMNFGGDKSWPAPEAEWGRYTGRKEWRPPPAFDAAPCDARIDGKDVVLLSPIDPFYGIQVWRRIHLDRKEPRMEITTSYERVSGEPSKVGIWIITQFKDPVAIHVPLKTGSIFPEGHYKFASEPWPQLQHKRDHLEITRDTARPHKMGCDADRLLWIGEKQMCLVTSSRESGHEYPDRGASAEVYTNPDPKKYIELEMLSPLSLLKRGEKISRTSTYTLMRRTRDDPARDAARLLDAR
jgi:hypothetical protein